MIVNIADAEKHLSQLIQRAISGEDILVAWGEDSAVKLTPVNGQLSRTQPRILGSWTGRVHIADDFDAPLPEEVLDTFHKDPFVLSQ